MKNKKVIKKTVPKKIINREIKKKKHKKIPKEGINLLSQLIDQKLLIEQKLIDISRAIATGMNLKPEKHKIDLNSMEFIENE